MVIFISNFYMSLSFFIAMCDLVQDLGTLFHFYIPTNVQHLEIFSKI